MTLAIAIAVLIVLALVIIGAAVWFLAPTMRTFGGPDFEPPAQDDASIDKVNNSWTITGGGAGG